MTPTRALEEARLPRPQQASPRLLAWQALRQVEHGRPLEGVLEALDAGLSDSRDRRFARELVFGCLRWQLRLDHVASHYCSRQRPSDLSESARHLLRLGLYQLLWLDRVPAHAAVHATVELAKQVAHPGIAGMINAVLRRAQREPDRVRYPAAEADPVSHLALVHSHPPWLVERWLHRWGRQQTEALLQANNRPAPLCIAPNTARLSAAELTRELQAAELAVAPCDICPDYLAVEDGGALFGSAAFARGAFFVQDANAALAVALLAPPAEARVLDLCSAPGGKATQIALRLRAPGRLLAADSSRQRLARLVETRKRLGLANMALLVQDARVPALASASFASVLADVPCSGTGTLGRRPDGRWRRSPDQLAGLAESQRRILAAAFELTAPGGVVVYSTCSLEAEENERVVEDFLSRQPAAAVEPAAGLFPGKPWAGRYVQTLPGRESGDGSFAARIRRRGP